MGVFGAQEIGCAPRGGYLRKVMLGEVGEENADV